MPSVTRATDHASSLRDSFALHLEATGQPSTRRIYLDALDGLIRHLEANGMPPYEVTVTHVEEEVQVRILDRGPGLPPDVEHLFELYYRAPAATRRAPGSNRERRASGRVSGGLETPLDRDPGRHLK